MKIQEHLNGVVGVSAGQYPSIRIMCIPSPLSQGDEVLRVIASNDHELLKSAKSHQGSSLRLLGTTLHHTGLVGYYIGVVSSRMVDFQVSQQIQIRPCWIYLAQKVTTVTC